MAPLRAGVRRDPAQRRIRPAGATVSKAHTVNFAGRLSTEGHYWGDWKLYAFILLVVAFAVYRTTRRETPRQHDNWVRLGKELDGRPEVTVRTRDDMPIHEVQRVAWMLGY